MITNACEMNKGKSANRPAVSSGRLSQNLIHNCYHCSRKHVLVKQTRTCIGPCETNEDRQKLLLQARRMPGRLGAEPEGSEVIFLSPWFFCDFPF